MDKAKFDHLKLISQVKLGELSKIRQKIHKHYDDLLAKADAAENNKEQLKVLYEGIKNPVVSSFHGDSKNFQNILFESDFGTAPSEVVDAWISRIHNEIDQGKTRSDYSFIFGKLLEQWNEEDRTRHEDNTSVLGDDGLEEFRRSLESLKQPVSNESIDIEFFDGIRKKYDKEFDKVAEKLKEFDQLHARDRVTPLELKAAISAVCRDNLVTKEQQAELKLIAASDRLCTEYAGVTTVLLNNASEWNWPGSEFGGSSEEDQSTLTMRLLRNRSLKWRHFLNEDILTCLFLQVIGTRWSVEVRTRLKEYVESVFSCPSYGSVAAARHRTLFNDLFLCTLPTTMYTQESTAAYESPVAGVGESHETRKEKLLRYLTVEMALARDVTPGNTLYVVCEDIQSFYPSLSHKLCLHVLELIGVAPVWISLIERFLAPTVLINGSVAKIQRGTHLAHAFSKLITEVLLFFADLHVRAVSGVWLTRVVDDIYFFTQDIERANQAQAALDEFLKASSLKLNLMKSGSVAIGPGKKDDMGLLPQGPVTWGLLRLSESGEWNVNSGAVNRSLEVLKTRMRQSKSVLGAITVYNEHIRFLEKGLATPCSHLGEKHLNAVASAMSGIHNELWKGESEVKDGVYGILDFVLHKIKECIPGICESSKHSAGDLAVGDIPKAWLYWPITAGGLGLRHPLIMLAARKKNVCDVARRVEFHIKDFVKQGMSTAVPFKRKAGMTLLAGVVKVEADQIEEKEGVLKLEDDWEIQNCTGGYLFSNFLNYTTTPEEAPREDGRLAGLVSDFVTRFSDVKGKSKKKSKKADHTALGKYWRWLIVSYSEQMLQTFGSFSCFDVEVVPLQLIFKVRQSQQESSSL